MKLASRIENLEQSANPEMGIADAIRQAWADREAGITRPQREYQRCIAWSFTRQDANARMTRHNVS